MEIGGWRLEGRRYTFNNPPTDGPKQALFGLVWDHPWGGWGGSLEVGGWMLGDGGWRLAFGGGRLEIR